MASMVAQEQAGRDTVRRDSAVGHAGGACEMRGQGADNRYEATFDLDEFVYGA